MYLDLFIIMTIYYLVLELLLELLTLDELLI